VPSVPANHRVTQDAPGLGGYVRYDGKSDGVLAACSAGRRNQNEPTIAIDPRNTKVIVVGANDYCPTASTVGGDIAAGYYRTTNGGRTWTNSLIPGYVGDNSPAARTSPVYGRCPPSGDPTAAFDQGGRLFYGFICFNRGKPVNGGLYVATYGRDGARYLRTSTVRTGTPSRFEAGSGLFQDKPNLVVDQSANGRFSGTVYVAWGDITGFGNNNRLVVARSTDHGKTFSKPVAVNPMVNGFSGNADLAVGPNGNLYLTYRTYTSAQPGAAAVDAIWVQRSTDGGQTFSRPIKLATIDPFDSWVFDGTGANEFSMCGDGPEACPSGYHYARFDDNSAVAADQSGVHIVWVDRRRNGQARIFVRNSPDGTSWPNPAALLDNVPVGHEYLPDVGSAGGVITVAFLDSRNDPGYAPDRPPGNTATGHNSGGGVDVYVAQSGNGGQTWSERRMTSVISNDAMQTGCYQRCSFVGDYLYVSAVPGATSIAWADMRDVVAGTDPRPNAPQDGFATYAPCVYDPNDIDATEYSSPLVSDPCNSQGGKDVNVYMASL
jgi:hypothetical protein